MRFPLFFVLFLFSVSGYSIQIEYLDIGPKSLGLGGGGKSLLKDPTSVFLNPANMCLEKSNVLLYYEASSYLNIGSIWDLPNRRFVFDPANFGLILKSDDYTRFGILLANYLEDYDFPQTKYKVLSFGFSLMFLPFLLGGVSLGPIIGFNDRETSLSLTMSSGLTFRFDNLSYSLVFRTPTSLSWDLNPYYPNLRVRIPPFLGVSGSFFIGNFVIVLDFDYLFIDHFSFVSDGVELFSSRGNFFDSLILKAGFLWYDEASGFRAFGGIAKKQVDTLSLSLPQIHLTFGTTFFVRIPVILYDLEFNFALDDQYLLHALGIWPMNMRKISLSVSVEMKL